MICPVCGENDDKVLDSRASSEGYEIRRRRECLKCGYRFSTVERIEGLIPMVVKKNGVKETYNESKILRSLAVACSKRPVSSEQMNSIAAEITDMVNNNFKREITSTAIGEHIMKRLRELDKVAYVRFASVYKDFTDIDSFVAAISEFDRKESKTEDDSENKNTEV